MINKNDNIHEGLEKIAMRGRMKSMANRVNHSPTLMGLKNLSKGKKMTTAQAHRISKIPGAERLNKSKRLKRAAERLNIRFKSVE